MLQEAIYKFKASGPMLLPELIDNYWIGEIKAYEDYAILPYEVHIPQPIDKVIDMFEMNADLAILYHLEPSVHTVFGHECCAYCYPVTERMFKINCKTSADGLIHELNVTTPSNSCRQIFSKTSGCTNAVARSRQSENTYRS